MENGEEHSLDWKYMQKMVISNYTGRYTTRLFTEEKGHQTKETPLISTSRYSAKDAFLFIAAATLLFSGMKYGNPNPD